MKRVYVHGNPNIGATDYPSDELAFKEALSHASEGMADETELLTDENKYIKK